MKKSFFCSVVIFFSLLFSAQSIAGKVYVYRNAEGVLVFSDAPKGEAQVEEVKLSTKPTIVPSEDTSILNSSQSQVASTHSFSISVDQPANQASIRDNTGSVYASANITPNLKPSHKVRILLDGKQYGGTIKRATEILRNVERGEHTIKFELLNQSGKKIAESETSTFYLHRTIAKPRQARAGG